MESFSTDVEKIACKILREIDVNHDITLRSFQFKLHPQPLRSDMLSENSSIWLLCTNKLIPLHTNKKKPKSDNAHQ